MVNRGAIQRGCGGICGESKQGRGEPASRRILHDVGACFVQVDPEDGTDCGEKAREQGEL